MRFRQRTKVDLPHPEGPITAVARLAGASMSMSYKAWVLPNQAFNFSTLMPTPIKSVRSLEHTAPGGDAHGAHCSHDQNDQDQGSRPCLAMPFVKRRNCVGEDL